MDLKKCRLCLEDNEGHKLRSLFETLKTGFTEKISDSITSLANIEIFPNDGFPELICSKCLRKLKTCIEFIQQCRKSDVILRSSKIESDDELCIDLDVSYQRSQLNANLAKDIVTINTDSKQDRKSSKHQCVTCGKIVSSRFRLKTHTLTHTGERPYSCDQCGKKFSLAQTLNVHMRVHTGEKPFPCTICGKTFAHSSGLITHRLKHTGKLPYACKLCLRKFRTIGHLQYHVRRHTGQLNFECDTCGRAFITRNDLKNHVMSHSKDKPLVCNVCGLRLSRSSNLKRHIKLVHNFNGSGAENQNDGKLKK